MASSRPRRLILVVRRIEMMDTIAQYLRDAPAGRADYVDYRERVLDSVVEPESEEAFFAAAFPFFERNDGADLGSPGPLVHFLERFYPRYVPHLCASVERKPTAYTLWMLNRILNSPLTKPDRERLMAVLNAAATNPAAGQVAREQALDSVHHQSR